MLASSKCLTFSFFCEQESDPSDKDRKEKSPSDSGDSDDYHKDVVSAPANFPDFVGLMSHSSNTSTGFIRYLQFLGNTAIYNNIPGNIPYL